MYDETNSIISGEAITNDDIVSELMGQNTTNGESDTVVPEFRKLLIMLAQYVSMEGGPDYI